MADPADRLLDELSRSRRKRIPLSPGIWTAFKSADQRGADAPDRRRRLRQHLDKLAERAALQLPRQRRLWDVTAEPALPQWVQLVAAEAARPRPLDHRAYPWHPRLAFLADQPALANPERWQALDAWLKADGPQRPIAVDRERSYEIFGDEKALESFVDGRVFQRNLDYALLNCYPLYEPLGCDTHPEPAAAVALVVENQATWHTLANWNRQAGVFSAVVYGRGYSFLQAWRDFERLRRYTAIEAALYFGDIDHAGLEIPAAASGRMAGDLHLPLTPCAALYRMLLDRTPRERWQDSRDLRTGSTRIEDWIGQAFIDRIQPILQANARIPQEALQRAWLDEAAPAIRAEATRAAGTALPRSA